MARPTTNNFSSVENLHLNDSLGIQFATRSSDPSDAELAEGRVYYNSTSSVFKYYDGSSWVTMGEAGSPATTWDQIFTNDKTFAMSSTTWTLTQSSNVALLTLSKTGSGAGAVIDISNSGTGADIIGESDTWQVSKAGAAEFQDSVTSPAIVSYGAGANANLTIDAKGTGTISLGATSTGAITLTRAVTATASITVTGTGGSNCLTVSNGDCVVSDGSLSITDADNAETVTVINNTASTLGAASSAAVVQLESTSLTTGCLLGLQLTEGTLAGGFYLRCWDMTGGAEVLSIGENGLLTIAGGGAANAFVITAGDAVMSDGSLAITDADNAASLSVTNNTATTASVVAFAGSGTFTGSTTSSFMTVTPSGLTTGTAVYLPVAAMTQGKALHIVANALTSGKVVNITSSATAITGNGRLLHVDHSGNAGTSAVLNEFSSAAADETTILRVTASAALALGVILDVSAAALTTGKALDISNLAAITTGKAIHVDASGTTLTTGILVHIDSAATAITGAGRLFLSDHTGATSTSGVLNEFKTAANDETVLLELDADSLTSGQALDIKLAALTTGKAIDISSLDAITTGKALHIDATGVTQTDGILVHVDSASTALTSTGRLLLVDHTGNASVSGIIVELKSAAADETKLLQLTADSLTSGTCIDIDLAALTTGKGIDMSSLAAITTGKALHIDASGVTQTDGILVHIDSASTAITATGRLLLVDHTGNATAAAGALAEFKSAAADNTEIVQITASAALAAGKCLDISAASMTTGCALDIGDLDALTTGKGIDVVSNSADTSARDLIHVKNDNTAAVGAIPLHLENDAVVSTNFKVMIELDGTTLYISDGTTPNGNLSGTAGDVCFNADSGKSYYCTGTTNWTAF